MTRLRLSTATTLSLAALLTATAAEAHSVAQVQTAKRIASSTVVLLDPQGNPTGGSIESDTTAKVGDILTFVLQFTPVPNNATRGAGGYITEYVPTNTEVVSVRILDRDGNTIKPKRGPQMHDGYGPRSRHGSFDSLGLEQGSMSALYADTGIFFSTDARTARVPNDNFLTVTNGVEINPAPTGAGQLDDLLGFSGPPYIAHNAWDRIQALAYGVNGGTVGNDGRGNTPFGFGSAVAGPETHYMFEKVEIPACSDGMNNDGDGATDYPDDPECASALDDDETDASDAPVGPWRRIQYYGSEIGTGGATDCNNCASDYVRVGVPTALGWELSPDNPLPSDTKAVRFAVGELIVGEEYLAEISLRVTGLPLDPVMDADVNCAEVFGGDAAMPQNGQDNTWRYYVPSPACVQLNLVFDLSVDKVIAVDGDTLTYTLRGKNLSTLRQTGVVVTDTFVDGDVDFLGMLEGPTPTVSNGLLTWPSVNLEPGEEYVYEWQMEVTGNKLSTLNRATYTSDGLPGGFSVVALTTVEPIVVLSQTASVDPSSASAGDVVHYTVTLTNNGTSVANPNGGFIDVTLPTGFSVCTTGPCAASEVNASAVGDPSVNGDTYTWDSGLVTIPANGGTLTLDFDVQIDGGVTPGRYTIDVRSQVDDPGIGRDVEISNFELAPLLVDIAQSETPSLDEPVLAGSTSVTGVTSEGQGATVTVYVNGNPVPSVTAGAGGVFIAAVPTLFQGQGISATVQAVGEVESERVFPEVVVTGLGGVAACNDGQDNDGDGKTDYPEDPGCTDGLDPDETDTPACSDGIDNDNDGDIDYPDDISCASYLDETENGEPECNDGIDNDDDGDVDFPDDSGCESAEDATESVVPACANGIDDDDDGFVDYPRDRGCEDANDDDESADSTGAADAGSDPTMNPDGMGGAGNEADGGRGSPPMLGGLTEDEARDAGSEGGCGCRTVGSPSPLSPFGLLTLSSLLAWCWSRRRQGVALRARQSRHRRPRRGGAHFASR